MLLEKQIQILVFKVDDNTFENIGEVNQYDSLIWPDKFNGYASFELWAPITEENSEYFKKGNILWCGGDNAAVVEIVKSTIDDKGTKTFNVKGRTLEMFFTTRIIWGTYNASNKYASTAMYEVVNQNCVNPTNVNRKIPYLECAEDAVVEIVKSTIDDKGTKTFNVKGRTLEMFFTTRIIWGTYNASNKYASTAMYEVVNQNCVNPTNVNRKIPYLECAEDKRIGDKISIQKTGGEVYTILNTIATSSDIGFNVLFRPKEKKLIFEVVAGVDRTVEQNVVDPVEFSTDLEDILSSSYYTNDQDKKSVALVMGEGEGTSRKSKISGDNTTKGFGRRELYVDARDIQSESVNEDGTTTTLTPTEYDAALVNRGDDKLAECKTTETFEAQIRVFGDVQYEFGKDYQKGDKVTVRDRQLNVVVSARITEVEEDFDDEYALVLTFGYSYPTIMQKVKQQIS
nr:minor tail protein [uncultured phage]